MNNTVNPKPFVKWAGGKRSILPSLISLLPYEIYTGEIDQYIEPFVGGGALFFALRNKDSKISKYILNDTNKSLMIAYQVIRDKVDELIQELYILDNEYRFLQKKKQQDYYYQNRILFNTLQNESKIDKVKMASLFIFLNKTCYNGLFRSNKNGIFNVPFGDNPNPIICDLKNLILVNKMLKSVKLTNYDFQKFFNIYQDSMKNAFSYIDPPYVIQNGQNGFASYTELEFSWNKQKDLAQIILQLIQKGVKLMISNANHKDIISLYSGMNLIQNTVSRTNLIGGAGSLRNRIQELVFTSYQNKNIFSGGN